MHYRTQYVDEILPSYSPATEEILSKEENEHLVIINIVSVHSNKVTRAATKVVLVNPIC